MTHRLVTSDAVDYDFAPDATPPSERRTWAVGVARLVDDVTEAPVGVPVRARTDTRGVFVRVGADGVVVLAARPGVRFPSRPGPRPRVRVEAFADGYLPVSIDFVVPDPVGFTTPAPIVLAARRVPVVLRGRVVRRGTGAPVAGASITLADYWRTQRDVRNRPLVGPVPVGAMTVNPAGNRVFAVPLADGVALARSAGATAGAVNLVAAPGDDKQLTRAAESGASTIALSNRRNVAASDLVRLDGDDGERAETRAVSQLLGVGGPDDPVTLRLEPPLARAHAPLARVERIPAPAGPLSLALRADAAPGDRVLFVDALPATATAALRIANAGSPDEYHACAAYGAVADGDGRFRLPPLHRMAEVRLDVSGMQPTSFFVAPEYGTAAQWLDLSIP
jgi:hypothetical protein